MRVCGLASPERPVTDAGLTEVWGQWQQHSKLLLDSDFSLVEPILALRSVALETLRARQGDPDTKKYLSLVLTDHLMDVCQLARTAGNTQVCVCGCVCVTVCVCDCRK